MKLETFIEESLKQIVSGVKKAKEFGDEHDAKINPSSAAISYKNSDIIYCKETQVPLQRIDFDIAIVVNESSTRNDGDSSSVGSITVAGQSEELRSSNTSTSRIKFSIPILLPSSGELID